MEGKAFFFPISLKKQHLVVQGLQTTCLSCTGFESGLVSSSPVCCKRKWSFVVLPQNPLVSQLGLVCKTDVQCRQRAKSEKH